MAALGERPQPLGSALPRLSPTWGLISAALRWPFRSRGRCWPALALSSRSRSFSCNNGAEHHWAGLDFLAFAEQESKRGKINTPESRNTQSCVGPHLGLAGGEFGRRFPTRYKCP